MLRRLAAFAVLLASLASAANAAPEPIPAFPGAEGFGKYVRGGRGGQVMFVRNLNDSGPGSLRAACEAEGARIVVFRVGGIIDLDSQIVIKNPYITIAGQTAPGDGICLRGHSLYVSTEEVIIRHLRVRPGDIRGVEEDAISVCDCRGVIIDHCSCTWATDETLSVNGAGEDITIQWCIIAECLYEAVHVKGGHSMGSIIRSDGGGYTFHHNIYAHNNSRNPRPGHNQAGTPGVLLDFRNNVLYDWGAECGYGYLEKWRMNFVGNYLRPGPSTGTHYRRVGPTAWGEYYDPEPLSREASRLRAFHVGGPDNRIYLADNVLDGFPEAREDNWLLVQLPKQFTEAQRQGVRAQEPFEVPAVETQSASAALDLVLERAGATSPRRDAVDERIIGNIRAGRGHIIDSQWEVGGWPEYRCADVPVDSDRDGMPDTWEETAGLDPMDPADANGDADGDGYTNIEEYINSLAQP